MALVRTFTNPPKMVPVQCIKASGMYKKDSISGECKCQTEMTPYAHCQIMPLEPGHALQCIRLPNGQYEQDVSGTNTSGSCMCKNNNYCRNSRGHCVAWSSRTTFERGPDGYCRCLPFAPDICEKQNGKGKADTSKCHRISTVRRRYTTSPTMTRSEAGKCECGSDSCRLEFGHINSIGTCQLMRRGSTVYYNKGYRGECLMTSDKCIKRYLMGKDGKYNNEPVSLTRDTWLKLGSDGTSCTCNE